jgi:predicted DNA-binding protein (MmcQ/YjbR family)
MADVVNQREGLGEIGVNPKRARHRTCDLRDFQRVSEPVAEMIGEARRENLGLRLEAPKRAGMQYAVAVASVIVAVGMLRFRITAPARPPHVHGVGFERHRCHSSVSGKRSATFRPARKGEGERWYDRPMISEAEILRKLRKVCLKLADAEETVSFGHPTFRVRGGRIFAAPEEYKGELGICLNVGKLMQGIFLDDPRFFRTPYIGKHGWVTLRVYAARLNWNEIGELVKGSYLLAAPKLSKKQGPGAPRARKARR